jgi:hypothetical protein
MRGIELLKELNGFPYFCIFNLLRILRELFEELPKTALDTCIVINVFGLKVCIQRVYQILRYLNIKVVLNLPSMQLFVLSAQLASYSHQIKTSKRVLPYGL